ncbi:MAG: hypothetical protein ACOXZ2_06850 [Sphaerochaetaceae bacterium]|nr:hypothetical protein [Sphaerochaetaceae bacterium]HHU88288.1 hypothetical protein [Spirochaetales bacterium]
MSNLTKAVLLYQKLLKGEANHPKGSLEVLYHKIEMMCQIIIYQYPVKVKLLQEEEAVELLLILVPRLKTLITTFQYQGIDFEKFLTRTIYLQTIYYKQKRRRKERKFYYLTCPGDEMEYYMLAEPAFQYQIEKESIENKLPNNWSMETAASKHIKRLYNNYKAFANRFRQFIVLNGPHLSAQQIAFLAQYLEIDELELAQLISEAHELAGEKHNRSLHVQEVRNSHYLESQFLKREIDMFKSFDAHYSTIEAVKKRYRRSHSLFLERCKEARSRPNPVTHDALSKLFEKPKGTIDSGMSALKKALREIVDDNE